MTRLWFYWFFNFLPISFAFSQPTTLSKDPTVSLENFNFAVINYSALDSVSRDYIQAIKHSLYHRFEQAETLLKKVALQPASALSGPARHYLLNELYFWRGNYADYAQFSDQIHEKNELYELASLLANQPSASTCFSVDSLTIPVTIRKHSYVITNVLLNGKLARLMLDSGASFSMISQKLYDELAIKKRTVIPLRNSVNTTFQASVSLLDSLSMGGVTVKNILVGSAGKSRFFKRLHVDGLLGWDVLRTFTYTTDFKAQTLLIRKPVTDTTLGKNLFGIGSPLMVVHTPAGMPLNMYFDSGSNFVDLTANGILKLGTHSIIRRPGLISGVGKSKIGFFSYVRNFTFQVNQRLFTRKKTYLTPIDGFILNIKRDGILSNAPFQKGRLTIDYLNNHFDYRE